MADSSLPDSTSDRQTLWVVSELYYPEETSTGYYLTRIAEGLADTFDVKVLCGQPNYSARGTVAPKRESHNGVEIVRAAGTTLNKNIIPFRVVNMLTLGISTFFHALFGFKKGDRVLVVTTPPAMPFVIALASLIRGAAYILLIHDNYPEILVAAGKAKPSGAVCNVLNFFNRWLYKHTSKIIAVGRDMKEMLEQKTVGLDTAIDVIPNWAELETVHPMPKDENPLLAELGLKDAFVLLYAGNMGHPNDLETIIKTADELRDDRDIHFVFLGSGVKKSYLLKSVEELKLTNVTILEPRPREEQAVFLNACDVAIVSLVNKMKGVSMPSRTYNILAAGKPILALTENGSEIARVIADDNVGWHCPSGDVSRFTELVRAASKSRNLKAMGERARNAALTRYDLDRAIGLYRDAITTVQ